MLKKMTIVFMLLPLAACSIFSGPKTPADTGSQAANTNVQLGLAYLQSGDVQRAKQKLLLAEQQAPQATESQGAMGYFLESTGNSSEAEAYYRKAATLHAQSGAAQNNYGTFLCRSGRYAEADQHFLLALQDPSYLNTAQVYENAGLCAMQIPDASKARDYFTQSITQDPRRAVAWLELGWIDYQQKNYQPAQESFDHYMQLTKDPTSNALWLGVVLARALDNESVAGRYTLMLQTRFPNSDAYKALMRTKKLETQKKKKPLYY